jgi:Zn-dependent protease
MLGWSINLFRVFGIQLAVHASFVLLLAYVAYKGWSDGGLLGMLWTVCLLLTFFVCVVLHELGHSLTARRYGIAVPRILLLPIGGVAEFASIPRKPSEELMITIAGPSVNFVISAGLFILIWGGVINTKGVPAYSFNSLIDELCVWNLVMGIFNLLPVFPMDGGRIFRALLAMKLPYIQATWWAAVVSKILAPCFACVAFYKEFPMLGVLFLFIFFVGDAEYKHTLRREKEALYWAEMSRLAQPVEPDNDEPPAPPLILQGPT